jgi:hypothetical protein
MSLALFFAALVASGYAALRVAGKRKAQRDEAAARARLAHPAFRSRSLPLHRGWL